MHIQGVLKSWSSGKRLLGKWPSISLVTLVSREVLCTRKTQGVISKPRVIFLTSVYISTPREELPESGNVPERDGLPAHSTMVEWTYSLCCSLCTCYKNLASTYSQTWLQFQGFFFPRKQCWEYGEDKAITFSWLHQSLVKLPKETGTSIVRVSGSHGSI